MGDSRVGGGGVAERPRVVLVALLFDHHDYQLSRTAVWQMNLTLLRCVQPAENLNWPEASSTISPGEQHRSSAGMAAAEARARWTSHNRRSAEQPLADAPAREQYAYASDSGKGRRSTVAREMVEGHQAPPPRRAYASFEVCDDT